MTLQERAKLATEVRQQRAIERASDLCRLLNEGEGIKRAAHRVGWSYRSARRWRQRMEGR